MSASASKKKRKELEEQGLSAKAVAERKVKEQKNKTLRSVLLVALAVAVIAAAVILVISLVNKQANTPDYDVDAAAAMVGEEKITVPMYDYFYNLTASNFYTNYSFLLEAGKPLSQQRSFGGDGTMEDYLKDTANHTMQEVFNVYAKAKADGYELSDEDKDAMKTSLESLKEEAASYGFPNLNRYLRARFGEGCSEDSYKEYMKVFLTYSGYAKKLQEEFDPSDAEIDAEYEKDTSVYDLVAFTYAGVAAESSPVEAEPAPEESKDNTESTEPEETTAPETTEAIQPTETTYTDEAKAAAKEKAEGYLSEMPEDAKTLTYNKSNISSSLCEEAAEWLFDAARKEGDVKVFAKTEDEIYFYAVRFESRDNNDYLPINANIISITKDKEGAETKDGEQTAQEKFEALKAAVQDGMTDEAFSAAVTALGYSDSASTLTRTYSIEQVRDFLFDESRKPGDVTAIETDTIYYVVRYVSAAEDTYRNTMVKNTLWSNFYESIAAANEITVDEEMLKHAYTDLTFNAQSDDSSDAG